MCCAVAVVCPSHFRGSTAADHLRHAKWYVTVTEDDHARIGELVPRIPFVVFAFAKDMHHANRAPSYNEFAFDGKRVHHLRKLDISLNPFYGSIGSKLIQHRQTAQVSSVQNELHSVESCEHTFGNTFRTRRNVRI